MFLYEESIYSFRRFHFNTYRENYGFDEAITYVGYPSSDNSGSYFNVSTDTIAISALSSADKQKGAWEFIRMLVSYDAQYKSTSNFEDEFPINKKAFEDMGKDLYIHENEENTVEIVNGEVNEGFLSKDEYNQLVNMINGIKKVNFDIEDDVFNIINDEIFAMFRGEKTSQQIADNIQSRVQLLISERS